MKHFTPISHILQESITEKEIKKIVESFGYKDTGRIVTVTVLIRYLVLSAIVRCSGFRELAQLGEKYNLPKADFSTLCKKASEVPFEIFIAICNYYLNKANKAVRKVMKPVFDQMLAAIDSTCLTAHKNKLVWAPYLRESSGVKYHVMFDVNSNIPVKIFTSEIHAADSSKLFDFIDRKYIFICDRGYRSIEKLAKLDIKQQRFVVRLTDYITVKKIVTNENNKNEEFTDVLCTLGNDRAIKKQYRNHIFRVVSFMGNNGQKVMLCTNIKSLSAEEIAGIYRRRWAIECFFRALKQNFSIKKIFGKSPNSVFAQGLAAFIAYILTYVPFVHMKCKLLCEKTFTDFMRSLRFDTLMLHPKSFRHYLLR